jgi:membrane-associated phospholipid phosphatase
MLNHMNPKVINQLNKIITLSVYTIYPLVLIYLIYSGDTRIWRVVLAPAISFILVSIFRNILNAPRPYEVTGATPIIKKDTKGKSFPSRHVFSVFVIGATLYFISSPLGIALMLAGCILAVLRVIGGVHFPRDVIAGAVIGILSGILGFYL